MAEMDWVRSLFGPQAMVEKTKIIAVAMVTSIVYTQYQLER